MPWDIARMTPWQVRNLFLCERDKDGRVLTEHEMSLEDDEEPQVTPRSVFRAFWGKWGLRPDLIEKLWREIGSKQAEDEDG